MVFLGLVLLTNLFGMSVALTIGAVGALAGPPISGAINGATRGFKAVGYYAGTMVLLSVGLMLISRHLHLKRLSGKF